MNNLIVLNQNDNVGVSQFIIPEKTKIEGHDISTIDPIPFGHKVCLKSINKGDPIIKYDQIIGFALDNIRPGEHVHSHNLEFREFKRDFKVTNKKNIINEKTDTFFNGILRDNGDVATRNYIGIVSTVNCSATVTKMIVERIKYSNILKDYPNIDGIVPITHSTGCGMNTESEGMQIFQRTIDGFKNHPNFSHVFVIGLGCECAQVSLFDESLKKHNRIHFLTIQDEGGTKKIVEKVSFMNDEVEVKKLTVSEVLHIQELIKKAQNKKVEYDDMSLIKDVVRMAVTGADEITDEEFNEFPVGELTHLSSSILRIAGLGENLGN